MEKQRGHPTPGPAPGPSNDDTDASFPCPNKSCWIHSETSGCELLSETDCGHTLTCNHDKISLEFPHGVFGTNDQNTEADFGEQSACLNFNSATKMFKYD